MKVIAFDLDDTLVRWQGPVREAALRAHAEAPGVFDARLLADVVASTWMRLGTSLWTGQLSVSGVERATIDALAVALHLADASARDLYGRFVDHLAGLITPYEDTATLPGLRKYYRLGVASNGAGEVQRAKLQRTGLLDLFDFVVISAEVGLAKPDPAFYQEVQRVAGVPAPEILVVGDNVGRDLLPAVATGMRAVWIRREQDAVPDAPWTGPTVESLAELTALLRSPG